jgi:hypothetical protein
MKILQERRRAHTRVVRANNGGSGDEERDDTSSDLGSGFDDATALDSTPKSKVSLSTYQVQSLNKGLSAQRENRNLVAAARSKDDKIADLERQLLHTQRQAANDAVRQRNAAPGTATDELMQNIQALMANQEQRALEMMTQVAQKVSEIGEQADQQREQLAECDESIKKRVAQAACAFHCKTRRYSSCCNPWLFKLWST